MAASHSMAASHIARMAASHSMAASRIACVAASHQKVIRWRLAGA
jgi:hypothetical protein